MTTVTSLKMILFGKVREGLRRTSPSCRARHDLPFPSSLSATGGPLEGKGRPVPKMGTAR
jgi:hypothetical protein